MRLFLVPGRRFLTASAVSLIFAALPLHAEPAVSPGPTPPSLPAPTPKTVSAALPPQVPTPATGSPAPGANAAPPDSTPPMMNAAPHITWSQVRVNGPYIAMTFDDGPSAKLTPQLLDILAKKHIHVTFFLLGQLVQEHPEIVRREVAEGHEVCNHSWDHPDLAKMSEEAVRSQLNRTRDAITAAIGKPPTMMRPPYGSLTRPQRQWIHDDLGYKIILWSVDPLDWKRPGPEIVSQRIIEGTRGGSIILSHDIHPGTIAAMPATFDALLAKGFKFVTVSELLAMELPPDPKTIKAHPRETAPTVPEKITGAPDALAPAPSPAH